MKLAFFDRSAVVVCVALAAVVVGGCSRTRPIYNVDDQQVVVPAGEQGAQAIRDAVFAAGLQKGWKMKEVEPGHIVGELIVRQHSASVDIHYDSNSYSIRYKDSKVLMYDGTNIHRNYNKWVQLLDQQIKLNLPSQS